MTAIFDADRKHRYMLGRDIQPEGIIASVLMVNPSDANETDNDPTMGKVVGIGKQLGWRRVIVGNLFARIGKDIKCLRDPGSPIGPDNDRHLADIIDASEVTVVAWGTLAKIPDVHRKRWIDIVRMLDDRARRPYCFGVNDDGHPTHPLMLAHATPLIEWTPPWFPNRSKVIYE